MNSEERNFTPEQSHSQPEPVPQLKRTVHPDSLKFMNMAKEILDNPAVQQAVESEQQKAKDGN